MKLLKIKMLYLQARIKVLTTMQITKFQIFKYLYKSNGML